MLALILWAVAARGYAQPRAAGKTEKAVSPAAGGPEDLSRTRTARSHFQAGIEHFQRRRFRDAIHEFDTAAHLVPSADLWFNIARAHEELNEFAPAIEHYRLYLRDRVDPPDRDEILRHIAALEERAEAQRAARLRHPTTGILRLSVDPNDAEVSIDGAPRRTAGTATPLELPQGRHDIVARKKDRIPFKAAVSLEPGVTTSAYVDLAPRTQYRSIRRSRIWTWVAAGVAAGAIGTSVVFGLNASSKNGDGDVQGARRQASYSDVALGAGLLATLGAAILYFVEGQSVGTERVGAAPRSGQNAR